MRKKCFLAMMALAISMSLTVPVTAFGTEVEDTDIIDDEEEAGEQTTVMEEDDDSTESSGNTRTDTTNTNQAATAAKSSDSSLSHLGISPGSLSPAFSSDTHSYTATVDAGVNRISVAATPTNSKAVIAAVNGARSIQAGTNTVTVIVEAENGVTTTYTITVTCGTSAAAQTTADSSQTDTDSAQAAADSAQAEEQPEGTLDIADETADTAEPEEEADDGITFDENGYLIYGGESYIPSVMVPEGEYVSLEKYNQLYNQSQAQRKTYMRLIILLVILLVVAILALVNLIFKLRDQRVDTALGLNREDAGDTPLEPEIDTGMIEDVSIPESLRASLAEEAPVQTPEHRAAGHKTPEKKSTEKKAAEKKTPEKHRKHAEKKVWESAGEELEILDLNDL
jgi:hypothetical protein